MAAGGAGVAGCCACRIDAKAPVRSTEERIRKGFNMEPPRNEMEFAEHCTPKT